MCRISLVLPAWSIYLLSAILKHFALMSACSTLHARRSIQKTAGLRAGFPQRVEKLRDISTRRAYKSMTMSHIGEHGSKIVRRSPRPHGAHVYVLVIVLGVYLPRFIKLLIDGTSPSSLSPPASRGWASC